jgi:hypothetical protein
MKHLYGVRLNGNALFALQVHIVQGLGHQFAVVYGFSHLQQAVCQGAFTVVNVCYDAKIPYVFHARINSFRPLKMGLQK